MKNLLRNSIIVAVLLTGVMLVAYATDLSVTASQVQPGAERTDTFYTGRAGATITAGQVCYIDTSANTIKLADADGPSSPTAMVAKGIAVGSASTGQQIVLQTAGLVTLGADAATTEGMVYMLSDTAGGIMPVADLGADMYSTFIGVGASGNRIKLNIWPSAVIHE